MPAILATAHLPYLTGLPEDEAVNTFVFDDQTGTGPTTDDISNLVIAFYNGGATPAGGIIGESVTRATNGCRVDLAEIEVLGPTPNVGPVYYSDQFTLTAVSGTTSPLPLEVAIVTSFYNSTETSVSIRRRRGRIYLGPINLTCLDATGTYPLVSDATLTKINTAAEALQVAAAAADVPWCVWSRAEGQLFPVDSGWTENDFDTQRRRGAKAEQRDNWSVLV